MAESRGGGVSGRRGTLAGTSGSGRQEPSIQGAGGHNQPAKRLSARAPAQPPVVQPDLGPAAELEPQLVEDGGALEDAPAPIPAPVAVPGHRQPVPRVSGRAAPPAAASTRSSRRSAVGRPDDGAPVKKKVRGVGKELMICFGILGFMALTAVVLYIVLSGRNKEIIIRVTEQKDIFKRNMKLGFDSYQRAETVGLLYVLGKEPTATDDKLFGPFKSDDKIYNVVYDRVYKDRRNQPKTEQKAMHTDRLRVDSIEKSEEDKDSGVRVKYGLAENKTIPIVIASKMIKGPKDDNANMGGSITVIAKAEADEVFEKAKKPKATPEKAEKPEKVEKPAEKPADKVEKPADKVEKPADKVEKPADKAEKKE